MEQEIAKFLIELINTKAVNPRSQEGAEGEGNRAKYLKENIKKIIPGVKVDEYVAYDKESPVKNRPNIIATLEGLDTSQTLYFITHMDTVPEGDLTLWESNPFIAIYKDGKVFGRGAEDNLQAMVSSIFALREVALNKDKPPVNISLVFVSDEETGSIYGIQYLAEMKLFKKSDLIIVPDYGSPEGDFLEVAEKGIFWFKIEVLGRQTHASQPHLGLNAHLKGMEFALSLYKALKKKFKLSNHLFDPSVSTFEPTKKEANVDNINTIPGKDVIYFDCRVLPEFKLEDVLRFIKRKAQTFSKKEGVEINISVVQKEGAPPITSPKSNVVQKLKGAIKKALNIEVNIGGIGGGTCAAILRKAGFEVAVWAKNDHTAHQVNEYARLTNILDEVKVFYYLMIDF